MYKRIFLVVLLAVILAVATFGLLPHAKADGIVVTSAALTASASTVYPSQNYVLTATGFVAGEPVEFLASNTRLATGVADGSGQVTATVKIPSEFVKQTLALKARNAGGITQVTTTVTLDPGLVVSVSAGSGGAPLQVQGFAFSAGEAFTATFVTSYTNSGTCILSGSAVSTTLGTGTTSKLGSFSVNAAIPNVPAGQYYVVAVGASSATCAHN